MGKINNMLLNGEVDAKTANALLYGCNVCLGAIRVDEQQAKLDELERMMKELECHERQEDTSLIGACGAYEDAV